MLFTDQLRRTIHIKQLPKRIISLVPSQTELLYDLGLDNRVVGITKFCIHPESWLKTKTPVGGTKKLNFDTIDALNPDLIIGNKEENAENDIKTLCASYPVWMSDITTFSDALAMMKSIAEITQTEALAEQLTQQIETNFTKLKPLSVRKKVLYLIWEKPVMVAGKSTFIDELLHKIGFENCVKSTRYPAFTYEQLIALAPDFIFLSSEPYPYKAKHIERYQKLFPKAAVVLVDGEYFSWYGSRLKAAPGYFQNLLGELDLKFNQ
jgi:ABC-type Fe3+-hydroxamate transport system substrate-binding protein